MTTAELKRKYIRQIADLRGAVMETPEDFSFIGEKIRFLIRLIQILERHEEKENEDNKT